MTEGIIMCGIAGIVVSKDQGSSANEKAILHIQAILNSQDYRGPDAKQCEAIVSKNNYVVLGHNRLRIIDLSDNSNQPMWDEGKRFCLVYNGMLYNYLELRQTLSALGYHFYSTGDTEVVLKAFLEWGIEALPRFNGMFALAIVDVTTEKIFLARDRFGVKPLYYYIDNKQLCFASTSQELAKQLQLQPNFSVLKRGINYWCYDSGGDTVYQDLHMVVPGEVMTVDFSMEISVSSKKYYCLESRVQAITHLGSARKNLIEQVHALLEDAICLRLQSDVPLGISLSGGVDSATLASIARHKVAKLTAFSFGALENNYSEAKQTQLTAKKLGLDYHFVYPNHAEMLQGFWQTLALQDVPFPTFSIVAQYFVFNLAKQHGVKVMLGGQGGDEIFMGYRKYFVFYLKQLLHQKDYQKFAVNIFALLPTICLELRRFSSLFSALKRYQNKAASNFTLGHHPAQPLWQRQLHDIASASLPNLLRYEDRNSMGNSIESRLPFLDYRLVELALSLPNDLKLQRGLSKWILRQIAADIIPKQVAFSRLKRGFDVCTSHWLASGIGTSMREKIKAKPLMLKKMKFDKHIDTYFSDRQLQQPQTLASCIMLAWLADKSHFAWS